MEMDKRRRELQCQLHEETLLAEHWEEGEEPEGRPYSNFPNVLE